MIDRAGKVIFSPKSELLPITLSSLEPMAMNTGCPIQSEVKSWRLYHQALPFYDDADSMIGHAQLPVDTSRSYSTIELAFMSRNRDKLLGSQYVARLDETQHEEACGVIR